MPLAEQVKGEWVVKSPSKLSCKKIIPLLKLFLIQRRQRGMKRWNLRGLMEEQTYETNHWTYK
jgi:hypothetical protein